MCLVFESSIESSAHHHIHVIIIINFLPKKKQFQRSLFPARALFPRRHARLLNAQPSPWEASRGERASPPRQPTRGAARRPLHHRLRGIVIDRRDKTAASSPSAGCLLLLLGALSCSDSSFLVPLTTRTVPPWVAPTQAKESPAVLVRRALSQALASVDTRVEEYSDAERSDEGVSRRSAHRIDVGLSD